MGEKVKTGEDVRKIVESDRLICKLSAQWLKYLKHKENVKAAQIRSRINEVRREILVKYDIIL